MWFFSSCIPFCCFSFLPLTFISRVFNSILDLSNEIHRQVIVDQEHGQYLGHPSTVLLEDGKTILCVYPKGHGKGSIVYKKSTDGGLTWSKRLPTPSNWKTSKEVPTIHRVVDKEQKQKTYPLVRSYILQGFQ